MKILIFAGTSEARKIIDYLAGSGVSTDAYTATDYGRDILRKYPGIRTVSERLDRSQMLSVMNTGGYTHVIDATHPYAVQATHNICSAAKEAGIRYLRVIRGSTAAGGVKYVSDTDEAADFLNRQSGRILFATGSKDLAKYTKIDGFAERVFVRMLPSAQALTAAESLGFKASNIICMQGPFSLEMNAALLRDIKAQWLVTKDSGEPGGYENKINAAEQTGTGVLVIGRPLQEHGYSTDEVIEMLAQLRPKKRPVRRFPLFTDISGMNVLVAGGGNVAQRRVTALLNFEPKSITVISPQSTEQLRKYAQEGTVILKSRGFEESDISGYDIIIAASDDRQLNHSIFLKAKELGKHYNTADKKEECSFFFPAVIIRDELTVAVCGDGHDHGRVKAAADELRAFFNGG